MYLSPIVCGLLFKYLYSEYLAVHFAHASFKYKLNARFFSSVLTVSTFSDTKLEILLRVYEVACINVSYVVKVIDKTFSNDKKNDKFKNNLKKNQNYPYRPLMIKLK